VHSDLAASTSADDDACVRVLQFSHPQPLPRSHAQHQQIHERSTQRADSSEDARWDGHTVLVMINGHANSPTQYDQWPRQLTHTI
jgi:hypothetical protein